jgi:hypothetical protein
MSTSSTLSRRRGGQLPYIVDDGETIGDSDTIIAHLVSKHRLASMTV